MKTFLVPTDFSETSKNAARYAAHIAKQFQDIHIILYNVSDEIFAGSDGPPLSDDEHGRIKIMELALESVRIDLSKITPTQISCVAEEGKDLIDSIDRFCRHRPVDLVIMGITGSTRL